MNGELLSLAPGLSARQARDMLRSFGIGAAPVVDDSNHPIGVLSLRDLLEADGTTSQRMSSPAVSVPSSMTLEGAARCLVARDIHHLIVVDAMGAAIGMLSALDVLRASWEFHRIIHPRFRTGTRRLGSPGRTIGR